MEKERQRQRSQQIFERNLSPEIGGKEVSLPFAQIWSFFFRCFSLVHTHVQKNEIEFSFFSFVFSKNIFPLTSSREGATNISISLCYVKTVEKKLNPRTNVRFPPFSIYGNISISVVEGETYSFSWHVGKSRKKFERWQHSCSYWCGGQKVQKNLPPQTDNEVFLSFLCSRMGMTGVYSSFKQAAANHKTSSPFFPFGKDPPLMGCYIISTAGEKKTAKRRRWI